MTRKRFWIILAIYAVIAIISFWCGRTSHQARGAETPATTLMDRVMDDTKHRPELLEYGAEVMGRIAREGAVGNDAQYRLEEEWISAVRRHDARKLEKKLKERISDRKRHKDTYTALEPMYEALSKAGIQHACKATPYGECDEEYPCTAVVYGPWEPNPRIRPLPYGVSPSTPHYYDRQPEYFVAPCWPLNGQWSITNYDWPAPAMRILGSYREALDFLLKNGAKVQ